MLWSLGFKGGDLGNSISYLLKGDFRPSSERASNTTIVLGWYFFSRGNLAL